MNPDLAVERENPPFNFRALTSFLYGGDDVLARRKYIADFVESRPELNQPTPLVFLTTEQRYENSARIMGPAFEQQEKLNLTDNAEIRYYQSLAISRDSIPLRIHYNMFLPGLRGQSSDEQLKKWLPMALSHKIIGTYAQTELGHGTNLKKLETTATYDPKTQTFIINSPTLTSTKWWPGNMGKSANHALVFAQMYTKGANCGIHAFLVQIREFDTHLPLSGITVGDIGPKFGRNSGDNGFLRLDHVIVPRDNMLMRFAKVKPDGTFVPPKHQKLVYGTMIHVRANMVTEMANALAMATTIATRYSCVRRQGEKVPGGGEVKLLDYQTQQYRLFPELAKTYAYYFAGAYLRKIFDTISAQIQQGNVGLLQELHVVSSGLKAYVTYEVMRGIEVCRLSCGGHGYSHASALPELYADVAPAPTFEGDNIVLFLQVARHLVKTVREKRNEQLSAYFWKKGSSNSGLNQECKLNDLLDIYEHAAQRTVLETVQDLDELEKEGVPAEDAWDRCAVELTKCSKAHVRVFLVKNFIDTIETAKDPHVKKLLHQMCQLYALYGIHVKSGRFVEDGYVSKQQLIYIRRRFFEILAEIRPIAVQFVDAFDFKDRQLDSVLGRYDGDVYANLYKWARESPLNKKDVLDSYHKYITPMMQKSKM